LHLQKNKWLGTFTPAGKFPETDEDKDIAAFLNILMQLYTLSHFAFCSWAYRAKNGLSTRFTSALVILVT